MQKLMQPGFSGDHGSEQQIKQLLGDRPSKGLESVAQQLALFPELQQELGERELIRNGLEELECLKFQRKKVAIFQATF